MSKCRMKACPQMSYDLGFQSKQGPIFSYQISIIPKANCIFLFFNPKNLPNIVTAGVVLLVQLWSRMHFVLNLICFIHSTGFLYSFTKTLQNINHVQTVGPLHSTSEHKTFFVPLINTSKS